MNDLERGWNYIRNRLMDELKANPPKTTLDIRLAALRMAESLAAEFNEPSLKNDIFDLYTDVINRSIAEQRQRGEIRPRQVRF